MVYNPIMGGRKKGNFSREAVIPVERSDTIRRYLLALLQEHPVSGRDISQILKIPEKDVYDHLEHIRKTLNKEMKHLSVIPAECESCGFVFKKRGRLAKPGKCPICHDSRIFPPIFSIESDV